MVVVEEELKQLERVSVGVLVDNGHRYAHLALQDDVEGRARVPEPHDEFLMVKLLELKGVVEFKYVALLLRGRNTFDELIGLKEKPVHLF